MTTKAKRTSRLEIRLTPDQRKIIDRAVALKGSTTTQWAIRHLINDAERELAQVPRLQLSDEAFDAFEKALEEPMSDEMKDFLARDPQWA